MSSPQDKRQPEEWEQRFDNSFQSLKARKYPKNGGEVEEWKAQFVLERAKMAEKQLIKIKSFIRQELEKAKLQGKQDVLEELQEEQRKFTEGFAYRPPKK